MMPLDISPSAFSPSEVLDFVTSSAAKRKQPHHVPSPQGIANTTNDIVVNNIYRTIPWHGTLSHFLENLSAVARGVLHSAITEQALACAARMNCNWRLDLILCELRIRFATFTKSMVATLTTFAEWSTLYVPARREGYFNGTRACFVK